MARSLTTSEWCLQLGDPVLQQVEQCRRLGAAKANEPLDEVAEQQHALARLRVHAHHRMLGLE